MKVLICDQHGGFGLSRKAFHRLRELGCQAALDETDFGEMYGDGSGPRKPMGRHESFCDDIPRDDPLLFQVYEEMGDEAAGSCCHLAVVELPDGVSWHVEEYDGYEHIAEDHRTWHAGGR